MHCCGWLLCCLSSSPLSCELKGIWGCFLFRLSRQPAAFAGLPTRSVASPCPIDHAHHLCLLLKPSADARSLSSQWCESLARLQLPGACAVPQVPCWFTNAAPLCFGVPICQVQPPCSPPATVQRSINSTSPSALPQCSWCRDGYAGHDPGACGRQCARVWQHRPQRAQLLQDCSDQVGCQYCHACQTLQLAWCNNVFPSISCAGGNTGGPSWLPSPHHWLRCRELLPGHPRLAMALALTVRLAYLLSLLAAFPLQASETLACCYCDQRFQLPWLVCSSLHVHG